jgi:hypothetical protein
MLPSWSISRSVFFKIFGLSYLNRTKLSVQRVGLLKIFDLHSINLRSKKALGQFFGQTAVYQTLELREMKPPDTRPAIDFHIKPVYAF